MNSVHLDVSKLRKILSDVDGDVLEVVEAIGSQIVMDAKRLAPVDEGDLRDSIYMRTRNKNNRPPVDAESGNFDLPEPEDELSVSIGPSVMHGIYQELGTSNMPAQPYLAPAVASNEQAFQKHSGALGKAVGG